MKDAVMVKPDDKFSALRLLQLLQVGVETLRSKLENETDETIKQGIRGAIGAYVELHTVLLEQVRISRIEEGGEESGNYDA
jgi:hypothetical protein